MTSQKLNEDSIEQSVIDIMKNDLGYDYIHGGEIAPDGPNPERKRWDDVILEKRLIDSVSKINKKKQIPQEDIERAVKDVLRLKGRNIIQNNEKFHKLLTEGIDLEYRKDGKIKYDKLWLIDFENPKNNDFLVTNQFTIIENNCNRRADIVVFVNGLPLSLMELKNLADEKATIESAYSQIQTYKNEIPSIFNYNETLIISDGTNAQVGTLTANKEWFLEWKADKNGKIHDEQIQLPILLEGMFTKNIFLDLIRDFVSFKRSEKQVSKIIAGYHQYYAANKAIEDTKKAIKSDGRIGVVWHTQGSGKSLTLAFYASKLSYQDELENPTLVVLTDRNDLDDQLFNTFSSISVMPEKPIQASSTQELKEQLKKRDSGGIIFATLQKFGEKDIEELSKRKNIIVAADEAHRSHYGFSAKVDKKTGEIKYGLAKYLRDALPNACFIGFTGTPIDFKDKSTTNVFGSYIDTYDIQRSVKDNRTVPIYYAPKTINIGFEGKKVDQKIEELLDEEFPGETEEDIEKREKSKSKWSSVEAVVGSKKRVKALAKEIVKHFEEKQKLLDGKAMVVCMSRRICVELYNEIAKIRPSWASDDDKKGLMKVIMTGSAADGPEWQKHIRTKRKRREMGEIFKKPDSGFKLALVRDMWLTGFDVPCLNTLYIDKPMKGHGLMQAIARVNRVYPGKGGGLVVDFIGIGEELKYATKRYTKSGGRGEMSYDQKEAIALMKDKYGVVKNMFHGFDYSEFFKADSKRRIEIIGAAMNHILKQKNGKKRFLREVGLLKGAFSLANPSPEANEIREEVAFFLAVKASLIKTTSRGGGGDTKETEKAVRSLISKSIADKGIVDIFDFLGIDKPDLSILSDDFLQEVQKVKYKNLAFEALKKLLQDEIQIKFGKNIVKSKKFSDMLKEAINKYKNRNISSAQIVKELVDIAKKVKEDKSKGKELGLSEEEEAFYDALANNKSAKEVLGDEVLVKMAHEIKEQVRNNASIDWTIRDSVQKKLRVKIKRLLRQYGYPPDKQKMATDLVIKQAEQFAEEYGSNSNE